MPSLRELQRRIKKIDLPVIQGELQKIIVADPEIVREKTDEFRAGELPDGKPIGEYQSESYRIFKLQKNPLAGGKVDLILTGAFVRGLVVQKMSSEKYRFTSLDEKARKLQGKYTMSIWGLNKKTWIDLQQSKYSGLLNKRLKQITGL